MENTQPEKLYRITSELKTEIKNFLLSNHDLYLVLQSLEDPKDVYTEDEMNLIIRYLGKMRMEEVFGIIEFFKKSVEEVN